MVADDGNSRLCKDDCGCCHGQPRLGSDTVLVLIQCAVSGVCTRDAGDSTAHVPAGQASQQRRQDGGGFPTGGGDQPKRLSISQSLGSIA